MIRADDKLAAVLAQDDRLLDVLIGASPAFTHLRNRLTRTTMARLVTVAQAARVAGLDVAVLLDRLNAAIGVTAPSPRAAADEPPPAAGPLPASLAGLTDAQLVDVDVRDDLRAGREPLRRILDAARALPPGAALRLRATFEPVPLYAVLGKQGFAHHAEQLAADDWRVWFHRDDAAAVAAVAAPRATTPAPSGDDDVIVLDVRGLEPPAPMTRTLEALATLPFGKTLVQLNVRVPQFLLPRLAERGFSYEIRTQSADLVRLFIRHRQP